MSIDLYQEQPSTLNSASVRVLPHQQQQQHLSLVRNRHHQQPPVKGYGPWELETSSQFDLFCSSLGETNDAFQSISYDTTEENSDSNRSLKTLKTLMQKQMNSGSNILGSFSQSKHLQLSSSRKHSIISSGNASNSNSKQSQYDSLQPIFSSSRKDQLLNFTPRRISEFIEMSTLDNHNNSLINNTNEDQSEAAIPLGSVGSFQDILSRRRYVLQPQQLKFENELTTAKQVQNLEVALDSHAIPQFRPAKKGFRIPKKQPKASPYNPDIDEIEFLLQSKNYSVNLSPQRSPTQSPPHRNSQNNTPRGSYGSVGRQYTLVQTNPNMEPSQMQQAKLNQYVKFKKIQSLRKQFKHIKPTTPPQQSTNELKATPKSTLQTQDNLANLSTTSEAKPIYSYQEFYSEQKLISDQMHRNSKFVYPSQQPAATVQTTASVSVTVPSTIMSGNCQPVTALKKPTLTKLKTTFANNAQEILGLSPRESDLYRVNFSPKKFKSTTSDSFEHSKTILVSPLKHRNNLSSIPSSLHQAIDPIGGNNYSFDHIFSPSFMCDSPPLKSQQSKFLPNIPTLTSPNQKSFSVSQVLSIERTNLLNNQFNLNTGNSANNPTSTVSNNQILNSIYTYPKKLTVSALQDSEMKQLQQLMDQ